MCLDVDVTTRSGVCGSPLKTLEVFSVTQDQVRPLGLLLLASAQYVLTVGKLHFYETISKPAKAAVCCYKNMLVLFIPRKILFYFLFYLQVSRDNS